MWEGYHFFSGYNMPVGVPSRRKQNMALQLAEAAGLRVQLPNAHHWGRAAAVESRRVRDRRIGWETWAQAAVACVSSAPPSARLLFLSASRHRFRRRVRPPCTRRRTPPPPPRPPLHPLADRSAICISFCFSTKSRVPFSRASWARRSAGESSMIARASCASWTLSCTCVLKRACSSCAFFLN